MPEIASEMRQSGWVIRPSLWFDAVRLIPLLAGLPFYISRHEHDARWWRERFASAAGQEAREAVSVLRREVAERAAKSLPTFLSLWTSPAAGSPGTAAECLDGGARGMRAAGLAQWWAERAEGDLRRRCDELRESFAAYDLVPLVERHTGTVFDARAVELCVPRWAASHGIRVTGIRFLTDVRYNADTVLNIALHELLHPPWPKGHPVKGCLDALAADPFLAAHFAGRDPAAGYNFSASYAEEDAA